MTKLMQQVAGVVAIVAMGAVPMLAQGTPPQPPAAPKAIVPLKVQITLMRTDGEKKTVSLPFTLWVNANDQNRSTNVNVGSQVLVPQGGGPVGTYQYRNVGTGIQCSATSMDDGRFRVYININDSSIIPNKDTPGPTFQSFTSDNYLLLRDGQTVQFLAATDKVSGEVTKVEVTIATIK